MKVILCSFDMKWEDKAHNFRKLESLFSSFPSAPDLVILPEMFTTGFTMDTSLAEPMDGVSVNWLKGMARQMNCAIIGSLPIIEENNIYNRALFLFPDGSFNYYDKHHLFRMGEENRHYSRGSKKCITEYKGVRFALNICYDIRFPVWSRNVDNEYDVLVNIASFPSSRIGVIEPLVKARAIENMSYVLFVNRTGRDVECEYTPSSMAVDFKGTEIGVSVGINSNVDSRSTEAGCLQIIDAKLDIEALRAFREKFPAWKDADPFTLM